GPASGSVGWWAGWGRPPRISERIDAGGPVRWARNDPARVTRQSIAPRYPAAAVPNAVAIPIAARKPPMGGPTNWFIVSGTALTRLFAETIRSLPTTFGSMELASVSNIVSKQPRTKATS